MSLNSIAEHGIIDKLDNHFNRGHKYILISRLSRNVRKNKDVA